MTETLALRFPLHGLDHIDVLIGAGSIEAATGLSPRELANLATADKTAIWEAMK